MSYSFTDPDFVPQRFARDRHVMDIFSGCGGLSSGLEMVCLQQTHKCPLFVYHVVAVALWFTQAGVKVSYAVEWDVDASVTYKGYHPRTSVFTEDAKVLLLKRMMVDRVVDLSEVLEVPPVFVEARNRRDEVTFPDPQSRSSDKSEDETEEGVWEDEPNKEWEVKKILAHCVLQDGTTLYLLEWEGWDEPTVCNKPTLFTHHTNFTSMSSTVGD